MKKDMLPVYLVFERRRQMYTGWEYNQISHTVGAFIYHWHQKRAKQYTWSNVVGTFHSLQPYSSFDPWFPGKLHFLFLFSLLFFLGFFPLYFTLPPSFVMYHLTSISSTSVFLFYCYYFIYLFLLNTYMYLFRAQYAKKFLIKCNPRACHLL